MKYKVLWLMVLLSIIRIWIGLKSFAMYNVDTYLDEWMMFRYADLPAHFANVTDPFAMAKDMSFPLFLNIVHFSGLPYTFVLSLVWVAAAWIAFILMRRVFALYNLLTDGAEYSDEIIKQSRRPRQVFSLLGFVFILFLPSAFDALAGTKLYRNAIIAPFTLLFLFSLLFFLYHVINAHEKSTPRQLIVWSVISGLLLSFNYYITESGIWLLIPAAVILAAAVFFICHRFARARGASGRKTTKWLVLRLVLCALPFIVLIMWTTGYKAINNYYFGVFEINTRTGGEPGKFIENIYKIASDNRTSVVWAPADAIDKAFQTSPTLRSLPQFREALVMKSSHENGKSLYDDPVKGDLLTWYLPDAMAQAEIWKSHAQVNDFFAKVNKELDVAFANGTLQRDNRFQISASAGGLTWEEIKGLKPLVWQGLKTGICFDGYACAVTLGDLKSMNKVTLDQRGLAADYMTNSILEEGPYIGYHAAERAWTDSMETGIIKAYQVAGLPLFLIACAGFVIVIAQMVRRKTFRSTQAFLLISMTAMILTAGAVVFGIAWFSGFLWDPADPKTAVTPMKYYAVASVACIAVFNLLGVFVVWMKILDWRRSRTEKQHRG